MIIFKTIRYKNILSTGNTFIEWDLNNNKSNLIQGINAAGKSTLLCALTFVLYGEPYRNINKPMLINSINKKDLVVEIEFDTGGASYLIRRGLKPNIFEVFKDGQPLDQNAGSRNFQKDVVESEILKMDVNAFKQIVILGKASYVPFMSLKTPQRREFIEEILNLKVFSQMLEVMKRDYKLLKETISENDVEIRVNKEKLSIYKSNEEKANLHNSEYIEGLRLKKNNLKKEALDLVSQITIKEKELETIQTLFESKNQKYRTELENTSREKSTLENDIRLMEKDINFFHNNENCPTCRQSISVIFKNDFTTSKDISLKEHKTSLEKVCVKLEKIVSLKPTLDKLSQKISQSQIDIQSDKTSLRHFKKNIEEIDNEIENFKPLNQNNDIKEIETLLVSLYNTKTELDKENDSFVACSHILKDTGLKSQIIKQYIPIINQYISKYLGMLDFFVQFEIDENFDEIIKSRFRDKFTYASFSEGEKFRIDISLLMVWRAIGKHRNSCSTNLLILDEVADSSLDDTGVLDMMKIINLLVSEKETVYMISHRGESLPDLFDRVITVQKIKNFTELKVE